jgi:hypothetical protein
MIGFYVRDGEAIAAGEKSAVVTPTERDDLSGPRVLVVREGQQAWAMGVLIFDSPQTVGIKAFSKNESAHGISEADRQRWWPDKDQLYLHTIRAYYPLLHPQMVDFEPGVNMNIDVPLRVKVLSMSPDSTGGYGYRYIVGVAVEGDGA